MKTYLFLLYFIISSFNSFGQLQNEEKKNRHTVGIGILPLGESIFVENTYHLKLNYAFFISPLFVANTSFFYFKNGREFGIDNVVGLGKDSKFLLEGNQFKIGIRQNFFNNLTTSKKNIIYPFIGLSYGQSNYEVEQDIAIQDYFSNTGYVKNFYKLNSNSFEFQFGMVAKITQKINVVSNFAIGISSNKNNIINTSNRLPDIGFTTREMGPFFNLSIDLFYNFNK